MRTATPRFTCPLCGHRFTEGLRSCTGCPLARSCDATCCPHCGYQLAPDSRVLAALRRWLGWEGSP